jgi:hypothetical protein
MSLLVRAFKDNSTLIVKSRILRKVNLPAYVILRFVAVAWALPLCFKLKVFYIKLSFNHYNDETFEQFNCFHLLFDRHDAPRYEIDSLWSLTLVHNAKYHHSKPVATERLNLLGFSLYVRNLIAIICRTCNTLTPKVRLLIRRFYVLRGNL